VSFSRRLRLMAGRFLLAHRMTRWMDPVAREIGWRLAEAGYEAGFVGGVVRDLLLGQEPKDWDLTTSAPVDAILALFPDGRVMGRERGAGSTVLVPRAGRPYEITPYRGDGLVGDLARRDFTINAMAVGLDALLIDPFGGQRDLARGLIRTPGDPRDRIAEDPLRMLRAIRFAAALGFRLDPALRAAIQEVAPLLSRVAPERIGQEWARILMTGRPAWAMEEMRKLGLLAQFAPEFLEGVGMAQNEYHAWTVWEHLLIALEQVEPVLHLRLAALLHDIGKPRTLSVGPDGRRHFYQHEVVGAGMAEALLARLRFDGETREKVVHLVRHHMDLHFDTPPSDAALRRMLRRIGPAHMNDLIQLRRADRIASGTRQGELGPETIAILQALERVLAQDAALQVTDLQVSGHDVMQVLQIPPGPAVGRALEALLQDVLADPARNDRAWLLARLEAMRSDHP
jgi:putative nucleotidyltransferase with HDIG domain